MVCINLPDALCTKNFFPDLFVTPNLEKMVLYSQFLLPTQGETFTRRYISQVVWCQITLTCTMFVSIQIIFKWVVMRCCVNGHMYDPSIIFKAHLKQPVVSQQAYIFCIPFGMGFKRIQAARAILFEQSSSGWGK